MSWAAAEREERGEQTREGTRSASEPSIRTCGMGGPMSPARKTGPKLTGLMRESLAMGKPGGKVTFEEGIVLRIDECW